MSLSCRFCCCTEDDPCRVESGEDCILVADRGYCTNPQCIIAADREKKKIRRAKRDQVREEVKPIRERWNRAILKRREALAKKRKKLKGRVA